MADVVVSSFGKTRTCPKNDLLHMTIGNNRYNATDNVKSPLKGGISSGNRNLTSVTVNAWSEIEEEVVFKRY
jgi:hypothetical protein